MVVAQLSLARGPICARLSSSLRNPLGVAFAPKPITSGKFLKTNQITVRAMSGAATKELIESKNKENPVMVYSATYCPYCSEVKSLFQNLKVPAKVIEVNNLEDGDAVRAGLTEITGSRTVPQVFIGGKHVGGCDDTVAAYKSGELKTLLASIGISI